MRICQNHLCCSTLGCCNHINYLAYGLRETGNIRYHHIFKCNDPKFLKSYLRNYLSMDPGI